MDFKVGDIVHRRRLYWQLDSTPVIPGMITAIIWEGEAIRVIWLNNQVGQNIRRPKWLRLYYREI